MAFFFNSILHIGNPFDELHGFLLAKLLNTDGNLSDILRARLDGLTAFVEISLNCFFNIFFY
jgi:hypothetical protein